MERKVTIVCKKSDNKAFKGNDDNWYNVNENVISYLTKMNKGDEIVITFEKKGASCYVSKIINASEVNNEPEKPISEFECEVCGKALKDGTFKKCYTCNESGKESPKQPVKETVSEFQCEDCGAALKNDKYKKCYTCGTKTKKEYKSNYGSPEDIAGKESGCALRAAATVASSQQFADPDTATQFTLILAEAFLEWMRAKK